MLDEAHFAVRQPFVDLFTPGLAVDVQNDVLTIEPRRDHEEQPGRQITEWRRLALTVQRSVEVDVPGLHQTEVGEGRRLDGEQHRIRPGNRVGLEQHVDRPAVVG